MKRIFIAIAALFTITCNTAFASLPEEPQTKFDLYEKYKDNEKVSVIYISPLMLQLVGAGLSVADKDSVNLSGNINIGGADISMDNFQLTSDLVGKLKGLYIIITEDGQLAKEISGALNTKTYNELMTVREGTDRVGFFYKSADNVHINEFLMSAKSDGELVVMKMDSDSLTMQDILNFAKSIE